MKKNKILIIATNDLGKSGVPEVIMSIARLLHNYYVFDVLITRSNTYYKNEFESYGGKVYTLLEKDYKNKVVRFFYKYFIFKSKIKRKLNQLRNKHYFAIHSFKDLEGGYYLKCAKKIGIHNRISHCSRIYTKPIKILSKIKDMFLLKRIIKYATKLVAISNVAGKSLFGNKKFEILYNTFNENYYYYDSLKTSDNLSLIQIGTFLPIKNQLFSIELAKILKELVPTFKLYLIGRVFDKVYYKRIINLITDYSLSDNVEIFDFDVDQNSIYAKSSFSIVPSLCEGLSLTAIESQAKGIKCFASTGVPREVSCGNIEFLELDAKLWAKEIVECFRQTKGRRSFADMSKFSNTNFTAKLKKIYELD